MAEQRLASKRAHQETAAYKTGRRSNRKGKRLERELAHLVQGERVPLSGALERFPNDVVAGGGWRLEAKGRGDAAGMVYGLLEKADVAAISDGSWLFACRLERVLAGLRTGTEMTDGSALIKAASGVLAGEVDLPWGGRMTVHRVRRGLKTLREWLLAEKADALCLKVDREPWLLVAGAPHMESLLR